MPLGYRVGNLTASEDVYRPEAAWLSICSGKPVALSHGVNP
jgi:hypothetical protein